LQDKGWHDEPPLHVAAHYGQEQASQYLLDLRRQCHSCEGSPEKNKSIQVNVATEDKKEDGHQEIIQLLLHKKADAHAKRKNGFQPLHQAAWQGQAGTLELLLKSGASLQDKD
jgi:ankyrin repeat protein